MPESEPESAHPHAPVEAGQAGAPRTHGRIGWLFGVALVGYVVLLVTLAILGRREATVPLGDIVRPLDWVAKVLAAGMVAGGQFLLLGVLATCSVASTRTVPRVDGPLGRRRVMVLLLLGVGVLTLLSIAHSGRLPSMLSSVLPLTGYLVGLWIGLTCLRGRRAALWLVPKVGLLLLVVGMGLAGIVFLAMDDAPLSFQPPEVTSAEKRRLVDVLNGSRPVGHGLQELSLSERDINLLLAMAMPEAFPEGKARVKLDKGMIVADASTRIADSPVLPRYINLHVACRGGIAAGQPDIDFERCRIGRISLPRFVVDLVSPCLASAILDDPELESIVASIESLRLDPDGVEALFKSG